MSFMGVKMSKINIYYFSGTGNTDFVVQKLKIHLEKLDNMVAIFSCENVQEITMDCDIVGIAFPIHTSHAPEIFSQFLDKFPQQTNMPLFGVVTSGYMAGDVLDYETKKLKQKGYKPFLLRNIVVANNMHLPYVCPLEVTPNKIIEKRLDKIEKKIVDISMKINNYIKDIRGNNLCGKIFGILQRSIGDMHEKNSFKGFSCSDSCVSCSWCVDNCPTNNITLGTKTVIFGESCILCMRCYNFCPLNAIQMTHKTENTKYYKRFKGIENKGHKTTFK